MVSVKLDLPVFDGIQTEIMRRIKEFGHEPITFGLNVGPGHDYWWILEYGSGSFAQDADGKFTAPPGIPTESKHHTPYPIFAKDNRNKFGELTLHFLIPDESGGEGVWIGPVPSVPMVTHPGIMPRYKDEASTWVGGFLRRAEMAFRRDLGADLARLRRSKDPNKVKNGIPTREVLVKLINKRLSELYETVVDTTPVGDEPWRKDFNGHLRDAWSITYAR